LKVKKTPAKHQETPPMEIVGRNPTPDKYSIKDIRIRYQQNAVEVAPDGTQRPLVDVCLLVELEPEPYFRQRFSMNHSYEKKKNPCTLCIPLGEFQDMQQAVSRKLEETYQFLYDHNLLTELLNPKQEQKISKEASQA
jgi:hypothetical protein